MTAEATVVEEKTIETEDRPEDSNGSISAFFKKNTKYNLNN